MNDVDDLAAQPDESARPIRRRHIVYVEGYDPRGAEGYFDIFRRTCDRFQRLWPVSASLRPLEVDSTEFAHWSMEMEGSNWRIDTRYDFLRLESFISVQMAKPTLWQLAHGLLWLFGDVLTGTLPRIFTASWRFGLHLLHFQILLLAWVVVPAVIALVVAHGVTRTSGLAPLGVVAGSAAFVGIVLVLRPVAEKWGVTQIGSCWVILRRFGRGRSTWLDDVVEVGARRILAATHANQADELAIVGHSSGCVIASAMMARALELDPSLGRKGPRLVLLTLGSVMPAVALHPAARRMRDIIRQLAISPALTWIDCQSRQDIMCFANFDPVNGVGVDVGIERFNPPLWRIRFREVISPENFGRFRWNHLRVHYQYIMAGDHPASYDYMLLVGGPMAIAEWPKRHRELMAAFIQEAALGGEHRRHDAAAGACS